MTNALAEYQAIACPSATIYLSGTRTIDFPDEVAIAMQPKQYQTMTVSGSTLTLDYYPLEQALLQLQGQYVMGTLTVKIMQPKPEF